ncbi:zinc protease [Spirosomataceae bacterium TFI 002]|nr:zinc protease [Spirosomataceae bacterium TFI 002]
MKKLLLPLMVLALLSIHTTGDAQTKAEKKIAKYEAKLQELKEQIPPPPPPKVKELPAPVKKSSVEGITEYQLANGMKVLLFPDQSQQTITVNITYLVGSRHEGYGETGMAHLLEHMVFKGSPKHPDIPKELSDHGARPNGTTWLDRTNYFETFAANDANLNWALDLESDRMVNSFIKNEDLQTEFSVVRNEFEMGENDPSSVLMDRIISSGHVWHNYGNSTIGSREDIERVPIDRLQAFYKTYYQPDNAVLMVAGKFDPEATLKLVNDYFGPIPRPTRKLQTTYTKEPTQDGERSVVLRRVGDVQYLGAMYHVSSGTHADFGATDVLVDILKNEPTGPLYKALVESKLASSQFGYVFGLKEPGYAYFGVEVPTDKDLAKANEVFLATLDAAASMDITQADVDRAKTQTAKYLDQVTRNSEAFSKMLSEYIAKGDWRSFFLFRDAVQNVTVDDVKRVAAKYFKPSNRTFGKFLPTKTPDRVIIPAEPNIEELVKDYKGRELVAEGEVFDPSPANIDSRTIEGKFANGMEYALLPKATRGNTVAMDMTLRIGDEMSLKNMGVTDNLTASMLMMGTKNMNRQEIKDQLDKIQTTMRINGGGNSVSISLLSTKEHLPAALKILDDVLKNPTFDAEELDKMLLEQKAQIEAQLSDPMAIAGNIYRRTMSEYPKGDIRYTPTFEEQLAYVKEVNVEKLKDFHARFYGASSATVSLVGDFEKDAIEKQLNSQFGSWTSSIPFKRMATVFTPNPNKSEAVNTPDKPNALFLAGIKVQMKDTDPDYPAMVMGNYLLGGGFLNSRLAMRIRQKEGISYGVGSQFSASSLDEVGTFTTYAIYAPENAAKLEAAFVEEINKVRNEGFTEEELIAAVEGFIQGQTVSRSKDNELAGKLDNYLYLDRKVSFDAAYEDKIKNLTIDQVNATFRKYIDASKVTMVKAGDFEKKFTEKPEEAKPAGVSSGKN